MLMGQDGSSPWTDLEIQHDPFQSPIWFPCKNWSADSKIHMKFQETQKRQNNRVCVCVCDRFTLLDFKTYYKTI